MKYTATLILLLLTGALLSSGELHAQGARGKKKPNAEKGKFLYGYTRNQYGENVPFVCLTDPKKLQTSYSDARGYFRIKVDVKTKLTITGPNLETTEFEVRRLGKGDIPVKEKPGTYETYEL